MTGEEYGGRVNYKRGTNRRRLGRKFGVGKKKLLHEWSRMLHRRWKLDLIVRAEEFKSGQE